MKERKRKCLRKEAISYSMGKRIAVVDRISQLPDSILQHILFFLPTKDATRTCILSKTWNRVWASLPLCSFNFDQCLFGEELLSIRRQESEIQEKREEFMNFVDDSLLRLCGQKVSIQKFRLQMARYDFKFASRIDHWIGLATKNYIKELNLEIIIRENDIFYTFPRTTFAAESLKVLRLSGCKLEQPLFNDNTKFTCLQELSLMNVHLDDKIMHNFIFSCPLIEIFYIGWCWGVRNLPLSNIPNLKTVKIYQGHGELDIFERIKVEVLGLQTLHYSGKKMPLAMEIDAGSCKNLKDLKITFSQITDQLFRDLISNFPLLETLALHHCLKLERVDISSQLLKRLVLNNCKCLVEVVIDTPNLHSFEFEGQLPTLFSMDTSNLREANLILHLRHHLDTLWFIKLRDYLGKFNGHNCVTLYIDSPMNAFILEELGEISIPPPSDVKHLLLQYVTPTFSHAALVDGLLWSCHPETLSVYSCSRSNNEWIKFLCENLIDRKEDPRCCSYRHIKCWRHYLKDIKIESINRTEEVVNCNALLQSLPTLEQYQEIVFKLRW